MILKRIFDFIFSLFLIIFLSPVMLVISLLVLTDSNGKIFYKQKRVGKNNVDFEIFKFRTMHPGSDQQGTLTVGAKDPRITRIGYFLRKYKLDELPQLFNVFTGNMSFVGPRPEVRKYVNMYTPEQLHVLNAKPGITDYASIEYSAENELLSRSPDPENEYTKKIMHQKLALNLKYIHQRSFLTDMKILIRTLLKIFFRN